MKFTRILFTAILAITLTACGSSSDFKAETGGDGTVASLASLTTVSSATSLNSDGSETATITTTARDSNGAAMSGISVNFATDSGALSDNSVTTNANGVATTILDLGGDSTAPRDITVTASNGSVSGNVVVSVIPTVTTLTLITDTPSIATDGSESAIITAIAQDENNALLEGVTVNFSSSTGEISPSSAVTGTNGQATATLTTATSSEIRDITVTGGTSNGVSNNVVVAVTPTSNVPIASIELITSAPLIGTEGTEQAIITALVKDESNNFVEGATVVFTSDSGGIEVTQAVTDSSGVAQASLSAAGDESNRIITVSASTGGISTSIPVEVSGTTLVVSGASNISLGDTVEYTVILTNSAGNGIPGETITLVSGNGNSLSATSVVTDATGKGVIDITAAASGEDTITAQGLELSASAILNVSSDELAFISPAIETEIPLLDTERVTVQLLRDNVGVPGEVITFSSIRGDIIGTDTVTTDTNGQAFIEISADSAGPELVTATTSDGLTTEIDLEFVATTPATIEVQASPFTLAVNDESTITAIVRDANNNLVKNARVIFSLTDVSGGSLSAGSAVTDSQGTAVVFFEAGATTSAVDGVIIAAEISDNAAINDTAFLTVVGREIDISIGTGNTVGTIQESQYKIEYAIQVTDVSGVGAAGVDVTVKLVPAEDPANPTDKGYYKGQHVVIVTTGGTELWAPRYSVPFDTFEIATAEACLNEDKNFNGILDSADNDINNNGLLEPGNKASVSPGLVTTDESGFAYVDIVYPKEFANWLDVTLVASTSVAGTEYEQSATLLLKGLAADYSNPAVAPPGVFSPFGITNNCADAP